MDVCSEAEPIDFAGQGPRAICPSERRDPGSVNGRAIDSRQGIRRVPGVVGYIKRYVLGRGCEDGEMSCKKFISLQENVGDVYKIIKEDRAKNIYEHGSRITRRSASQAST